jgi:hypothetical protein
MPHLVFASARRQPLGDRGVGTASMEHRATAMMESRAQALINSRRALFFPTTFPTTPA